MSGSLRAAIAIAVTPLVLCACGGSSTADASPSPSTMTVTGSVTVPGFTGEPETPDDLTDCRGIGGAEDLRKGAVVLIMDNAGAIVGRGAITGSARDEDKTCTLNWSVDAPAGFPFYSVQIGDQKEYVISAEEATKPVNLVLG